MNKLYRYKNFYEVVAAGTVSVMFVMLYFRSEIQQIIRTYIDFDPKNPFSIASGYLISVIFSSATYTALYKGLGLLIRKNHYLKSHVFGENLLEGFWVGYIEHPIVELNNENQNNMVDKFKNVSFIVEKIVQDVDFLEVKGRSYRYKDTKNGRQKKRHSSWVSNVMVLEPKKNSFYYTFENKGNITDNLFSGFARFDFSYLKSPNTFLTTYCSDFKNKDTFTMEGKVRDFSTNNAFLTAIEIKVSSKLDYDIETLVDLSEKP